MTKTEFIDFVHPRLKERGVKLTKQHAKIAVDEVLEAIKQVVADYDELSIYGFGKFGKRHLPERPARNPRTGEEIMAPATTKVSFKPSNRFLNVD